MATLEFNYTETNDRCYPTIKFHIRNKDRETDIYGLIDSGASISIFSLDVAELLGIDIQSGKRRISTGIIGKVEIFIHELEIKIFDNWFPCKIGFSKDITTSFNLLGREDFFIRHLITFNEKDRKTIIKEVD